MVNIPPAFCFLQNNNPVCRTEVKLIEDSRLTDQKKKRESKKQTNKTKPTLCMQHMKNLHTVCLKAWDN